LGLHLSIIKSKDAQTQVPKQLKTDICRVVKFRSQYLELMAQRRQVLLERQRVLSLIILAKDETLAEQKRGKELDYHSRNEVKQDGGMK